MLGKVTRRVFALPSKIPGYLPAVRQARRRSFAILMYHGVTAERQPTFNWCQLDVSEFERQIDFLASTYNVLPLDEVIERLRQGRPLPDWTACLTFDDGFRNVATTAFPILERRQLPSTIFLVTSLVGTNQPAWPDRLFYGLVETKQESIQVNGSEYPLTTPSQRTTAHETLARRLKQLDQADREAQLSELKERIGWPEVVPDSPMATMDWDEVKRLARSGLVRFGSHTHTHPILSRCSPDLQRRELEVSRDILRNQEEFSGLFAYPNGTRADFSNVTKQLLHELDYHCAVASIPGLNPPDRDRFELRRVNVGADMELPQFELRMVAF